MGKSTEPFAFAAWLSLCVARMSSSGWLPSLPPVTGAVVLSALLNLADPILLRDATKDRFGKRCAVAMTILANVRKGPVAVILLIAVLR